jgi:AcrR family transcriptional regulator
VQELADVLKEWARRCRSDGPLPAIRTARATPSPPVGGRAPGTLSLSVGEIERRGLPRGEGNVSRSFVVHNQRERILDALANLSAVNGYGPTTIPEIVREAAVSVQAFYEHFSGKEDAFLVAYELGHRKGLAIVERSYQATERRSDAVCAAVRTLLEFLASEPAYAHLALVDALTASPKATSVAEEGRKAYAALLARGIESAEAAEPAVRVAAEATASLLFELCFVYVIDELARDLPRLGDLACALAVRAFTG